LECGEAHTISAPWGSAAHISFPAFAKGHLNTFNQAAHSVQSGFQATSVRQNNNVQQLLRTAFPKRFDLGPHHTHAEPPWFSVNYAFGSWGAWIAVICSAHHHVPGHLDGRSLKRSRSQRTHSSQLLYLVPAYYYAFGLRFHGHVRVQRMKPKIICERYECRT
jgi:hypothetical protein